MDAHEHDAVSDRALEGELRTLLGVAPSRDFVARVRTRVAQEPRPHAWWLAWLAGAGVAAIVVAFVVTRETGSKPPALQQAAVEDARRMPDAAGPGRHGQVDREGSALQPRAAQHRRRRPAPVALRVGISVANGPEILVDPREAAALRALIRGTRDGRIDPAALAAAAVGAAPKSPDAIAIAPIVVEPLTAAEEKGVQP